MRRLLAALGLAAEPTPDPVVSAAAPYLMSLRLAMLDGRLPNPPFLRVRPRTAEAGNPCRRRHTLSYSSRRRIRSCRKGGMWSADIRQSRPAEEIHQAAEEGRAACRRTDQVQTSPLRKEHADIRAAARIWAHQNVVYGPDHEKSQRDHAAKEYRRGEPESTAAGTPGHDAARKPSTAVPPCRTAARRYIAGK